MMSGLFGACLFMYGMPIRRKGLYGFEIFLIVCMAGVFWLTDGKLEAVEQARKDMVHGIHELRYFSFIFYNTCFSSCFMSRKSC